MPGIISYGSHGMDVKHLQELLNLSLTGPKVRVDGVFGPQTEVALRLFQASVGEEVDGIAGPRTWAILKRAVPIHHTAVPARQPDVQDAPWMRVANQEIGQKELAGSRHNPRILEYHATTTLHALTDETSWCSSFVNWCLDKAGIPGTGSAAAISWVHWGKPSEPKTGAITVIHSVSQVRADLSRSGYHVAFFMQEGGTHHCLLGGNQSDRVKITLFPKKLWRIVAQRWPNGR